MGNHGKVLPVVFDTNRDRPTAWPHNRFSALLFQGRLTNAASSAADEAAARCSSRLSRAQLQRGDELARLQRQHEADQRSVAAIAQDLRMHGTAQPAGQ